MKTSSTSINVESNSKVVDRLFLKFAAFYGHVWRSQFKNESFLSFAKKEWVDGLKNYDERLIQKIVYYCREHNEFPPTLPAFINLCKQETKRNQFFKFKDYKKADRETSTRFISNIKKLIGK